MRGQRRSPGRCWASAAEPAASRPRGKGIDVRCRSESEPAASGGPREERGGRGTGSCAGRCRCRPPRRQGRALAVPSARATTSPRIPKHSCRCCCEGGKGRWGETGKEGRSSETPSSVAGEEMSLHVQKRLALLRRRNRVRLRRMERRAEGTATRGGVRAAQLLLCNLRGGPQPAHDGTKITSCCTVVGSTCPIIVVSLFHARMLMRRRSASRLYRAVRHQQHRVQPKHLLPSRLTSSPLPPPSSSQPRCAALSALRHRARRRLRRRARHLLARRDGRDIQRRRAASVPAAAELLHRHRLARVRALLHVRLRGVLRVLGVLRLLDDEHREREVVPAPQKVGRKTSG